MRPALYDISPDGQRCLMIKQGGGSDEPAAPVSLIVVQHWIPGAEAARPDAVKGASSAVQLLDGHAEYVG